MPLIMHLAGTVVVLDEANIQRVSARDPLVVELADISRVVGMPITRVVVTFGTDADLAEIMRLSRDGRPRDALNYACRGWTRAAGDFDGMVHVDPAGPFS